MKVIIGLGNPGKKYEQTRHNVGFLVVDEIARRAGESFRSKSAIEAEICELPDRTLLVKPQTFMNVVGRSLSGIMKKYPTSIEEILVVYDDADLKFTDIRFKTGGGSAGHRGMESILGVFPRGTSVSRVRVGIGRPSHPDVPLEDFVLQKWSASEAEQLEAVIDQVISTIESEWL